MTKKHVYQDKYLEEQELKAQVSSILLQENFTQVELDSAFLQKQGTLYNTHTQSLIEGYLDEAKALKEKMVLHFTNEHELALYFDIVDHLCQVVILKGRQVLLEPEHYSGMLHRYLDICQRYMMFLAKDEDYSSTVTGTQDLDP